MNSICMATFKRFLGERGVSGKNNLGWSFDRRLITIDYLACRSDCEAPAALAGPSTVSLMPGQTGSASLSVTGPADGTYFVNVTKVGAGGVRLEKQGAEQTMPGGEKVISLPSK